METPEQRIVREFKERYGTDYGTPTILPDTSDGVGYVYKFSNGKTISVEGWADMTEVTRRKFVGLALLDPRTNLSGDGSTPGGGNGGSGLGLPNWLLYALGGSILLVVVAFVIKSFRK